MSVVLNWRVLPHRGVNKFLEGLKPLCALQYGKFDQLNKSTNTYISFTAYLQSGASIETKDNYLREMW